MKKVLVPLAVATLLLSACKASVTAPASDDGMTASSASSVMGEKTDGASVDVDAGAAMEATDSSSSQAAAQ
jgi:uncharacterized protein YceK